MATGTNDSDLLTHGQEHLKAFKRKSVKAQKSETTPAPKPKVQTLQPLKIEPVSYDTAVIEDFLDTVFHAVDDDSDEHVLCFINKLNSHGYPISDGDFINKLSRTRKAAALYVSTSTVTPTAEGLLRNRNDQFSRFHVVVLDDIGTKIPLDALPENFEPTYIVETSEGNFQYGYVLETPIADFLQAKTLIELVAQAGLTDKGGLLVAKEVRCPEGIHGKRESKDIMFRTRLHKLDGPLWTPEDILSRIGSTATWADICADADEVRKRHLRLAGASHWIESPNHHATADGHVDPVLEWLYQERYVINTGSPWVTIKCPNAAMHSDGNEAAYYSPLGHGEKGQQHLMRGFNCFHESCRGESSTTFLNWVVANGGPFCAAHDHIAHLTSTFVFDGASNTVWRVKDCFAPEPRSMEAFKNSYPLPVRQIRTDKKGDIEAVDVEQHKLWMKSRERVNVEGTIYDPSTTARIVKDRYGIPRLNEFSRPDFGVGAIDMTHVDKFLRHIYYLIPNRDHAELFLDWVAAKLQNMAFRGWGILMIAKQQGTGRGALVRILTEIFHPKNCENQPFSTLIGNSEFNEWRAKALVFTDEAADDDNSTSFFAAYNKLKELVDPNPKQVTINQKYGSKNAERMTYTSHLMCVNSSSNTRIDPDDRRFFVIQNSLEFESEAYFTDLYKWIDQLDATHRPVWLNHLGRWLLKREVDSAKLSGRAPVTEMRQELVEANLSPLDIALRVFLEEIPTPFFTTNHVVEAFLPFADRLHLDTMRDPKKTIRNATAAKTVTLCKAAAATVRIGTMNARPTARLSDAKDPLVERATTGARFSAEDRARITDAVKSIDLHAIKVKIEETLDAMGR